MSKCLRNKSSEKIISVYIDKRNINKKERKGDLIEKLDLNKQFTLKAQGYFSCSYDLSNLL